MGANMPASGGPAPEGHARRSSAPVSRRGPPRDAGDLVLAKGDGKVVDVDGTSITVEYATGPKKKVPHRLDKFRRSNQGTCINQKPLVNIGDESLER